MTTTNDNLTSPRKYVGYCRVSTARQGLSGLGLEAQKARILEHVNGNAEVLEWYTETESGARSDRPQLELALSHCELVQATLVVATLDRLSRDVAFLEVVKTRCAQGGFDFCCADMPEANSLLIGIMAQVAAYERERISQRTVAALRAAKARGTKLGAPQGAANFKGSEQAGRAKGAVSARAIADEWAEKRRDLLAGLLAQGKNFSQVAEIFSSRGIQTRRGGKWTATAVRRLCLRLGLADGLTG